MQLASLVISICLHLLLFLLIWFWPAPPPLKLDTPPIMISLVEGDMGGSNTPSPILGHMGESSDGPKAPAAPAPQSEIAAPERQAAIPPETPVKVPPQPAPEKKPEPVPVKRPEPPREPEPPKEPEPIPVEKKPEPPREKPKPPEKKPEEKPKPPEKKPAPPKEKPKPPEKKPAPKKPDPVAAALQQARKATSRASSGDRGNAVEQALAQARRNAAGNRGGGGGQGAGPGGGGLGDVYIGQVMLAVRPNWGFASSGRRSLVCVVKVNVDMQGNVLEAVISRSSGNAQYDASAVNAVVRTGQAGEFPPPPNASYTDLDLVFTMDELSGR